MSRNDLLVVLTRRNVARRTMKVIDVAEVLEHWHAGKKMVELSSSLGIDPKTVRKYVAPAVAAGSCPVDRP
jgi:DNA-binding CsgD family transcriptional regulator